MPVYFSLHDNSSYVKALMNNRIHLMNNNIGMEVKKNAMFTTPLKKGDLSTQVFVRSQGNVATITWEMPYASYQERGMRADGSHVIKNYTTPGTGPHFAYNAVHDTLSNFDKLWGRTIMSVPAKKH